jgi:hypothetical protein
VQKGRGCQDELTARAFRGRAADALPRSPRFRGRSGCRPSRFRR